MNPLNFFKNNASFTCFFLLDVLEYRCKEKQFKIDKEDLKMTRTWEFEIDNEVYEMTMEEMVECLTRGFAKELLNEEDYETFCKKQDEKLRKHEQWQEEFRRTTYTGDELRDAR